jgi:hypothetical protein
MKKLILIIVAVVVLGGGAAVLITHKKNTTNTSSNSTSTTSPTPSNEKFKIVEACTAFTQADAEAVLGAGSKAGTNTGDTNTDDISVSTCSYTGPNSTVASLLARSAKTVDGASSNMTQFASLPSTAVSVSGYGDKAYWDSTYGQLNILRNNNWYILSAGAVKPADKSIDVAKKMADQIISKL